LELRVVDQPDLEVLKKQPNYTKIKLTKDLMEDKIMIMAKLGAKCV
jgi:hypothetical protein